MSDYNSFIKSVLSKKDKITKKQLEKFADEVATFESNRGGRQPIPTAAQFAKGQSEYSIRSENPVLGPGRGAFQFELSKEKAKELGMAGAEDASGAADTALKRLKQYYQQNKLEQPKWITELKEGFDPAALSYEQQKMLFIGDMMMKKGADLNDISNPDFNPGDFWAKYHKISGVTPSEKEAFNKYSSFSTKPVQLANAEEPLPDDGFNRERSGGRGFAQRAQAFMFPSAQAGELEQYKQEAAKQQAEQQGSIVPLAGDEYSSYEEAKRAMEDPMAQFVPDWLRKLF